MRLVRRGGDAANVLRRHLSPHRALAELLRLVDPLAHAAEGTQLALACDRRTLPFDLQDLEAVVAHTDAKRAVAIGGLEKGLPQIGRFEDVAVTVDHELGGHRVLLRPALDWRHYIDNSAR